MNRAVIKCFLLAISAAALSYGVFGPPAVLAAGPPLPMPDSVRNELGGAVARIDPESWRAACRASGLPELFDPTSFELEPVRRLVEASRAWSSQQEGDALGRMGEIALALEQHENAIDLFAAAAAFGLQPARWFYLLGAECQVVGKPDAARSALERALELEPNYGVTHARLGQLALDVGHIDEAARFFEACSKLPQAPSYGFVGLARVARARADPRTALAHVDQALQLTPNDHVAHQLRSTILAELGRDDEARASAEVADRLPRYRGWLSFDPKLQEAHAAAHTQRSLQNRLTVARTHGDFALVAALAVELAERAPLDPDAWTFAAAACTMTADRIRAHEFVERALGLAPDSISALQIAAEVALSSGDASTAEARVTRLLELAPNEPSVHQNLARVRFLQNRVMDALVSARRAVQLAPDAPEHRRVLVEVLLRTNRAEETHAELTALLKQNPDDAWARSKLEESNARR